MHNTTEKRWPDHWLSQPDGTPEAGAFPSRFEYAHALGDQITDAMAGGGASLARRVAHYATSGLVMVAVLQSADSPVALRRLQFIAREVL